MLALKEPECCALAGTDCRPTPLRRRASRPQLKRDPLGGRRPFDYELHVLSAVIGFIVALVLAVVAFKHHEAAIGIAVAVVGILHALYRIRRGG